MTLAVVSAGLSSSSLPALFDGITAGNHSAVPGINGTIIQLVSEQVTRAYISSFRMVFYVTIPFSALLILAAFFVPNMEIFLGNNVAKKLQSFSGREKSRAPSVVEGEQKAQERVDTRGVFG